MRKGRGLGDRVRKPFPSLSAQLPSCRCSLWVTLSSGRGKQRTQHASRATQTGPPLSTCSVPVPVNYSHEASGPGENLKGCANRGKACRILTWTGVLRRGRCKGSGVKGLRNELMNPCVVTLRDVLVVQLAPGDWTLIPQKAPSRFKAFLLCTIS